MMRRLIPYMACLLILASCIKDGFVTSFDGSNGRLAIDFSTTTEATKADLTNSDLQQNGWGLFGYYTGTSDYTKPGDAQGVLFNHRQVRWDSTNSLWDYSRDEQHKKEYWPMSSDEKVSFFAYAPYAGFHENASVDATNGPQVTYTASTDLAAQKDLLWATNTSGLPHRNVGLASYPDSTVDMHFRHAPAKIHFTINGATLGDETGAPVLYGNPNTSTSYGGITRTDERTGGYYGNYTLYYAYRTKTVVTTQTYRQTMSGFKILLNSVEMENFIREGTLHLNNPDAYVPYWTHEASGEEDFLTYTFGTSDMVASVTNPNNESTLSSGWGTTYLGVDSDPKELLPTPNNYIYMVPKAAKTGEDADENITITVTYHIIGLSKKVEFTRTTTTVSYQRVPYYTRSNGSRVYYQTSNNRYTEYTDNEAASNANNMRWSDIVNSDYPSTTSDPVDGASTDVNVEFNYSQDNDGAGFLAVGSINSDIVGSRDYTINLYLDGRELRLTVIPQPWDLNETMYDYNSTLNPVIQALTYDSDFVYEVIGSNVYINNRMGKFYFKLGPGMYLYWQASLIGDDAFAFTDANGNYLLDEKGNYRTTVRGDIGDAMNYIYVKAINTSSPVTSKAKLRIYLFNSENRAVVALPKPPDWLFLSSTFINDQNQTERVQEWTVVQTAN